MAKGKTKRVVTTTTTTAPDEDDLFPDSTEPTEEEIQDEVAAEEFSAEWGTPGNRVRVVQMDGIRPRTIGTYPAELLTVDKLQEDQPAGGYFELTLVGPNGRYIKKKVVDLGPLPASLRKTAPDITRGPALDPWPLMIQMMQSHAQQQNALLVALLNNRNGGTAEKVSDMVQAVVALNGAMKPPNQTELLSEIFDIADKIKAGGETGWSVLKEALPAVMERLGGLIPSAPAPVVQPIPAMAAPAETITNGAAAPVPAVPIKTDYEFLRETITELKGYARRNKDVPTMIAWSMERDDERGFEILLDAIERFPFEQLIAYDDEISTTGTLRDWFFRFYSGVRNALLETVDTGGAGGNSGHAGTDGRAGA